MNQYDLTTVDCTHNYTHGGKVSKYVICTTTMYVVPISAKSYAFCAMLPMVSQVTLHDCHSHLVCVQSVLLTPYQANNNHGTIGRLPLLDTLNMRIFNLDYGSKIVIKYYWRLKTIKNIDLTKTISHNLLQEPIKIQHYHKGTTPHP